MTQTQTAFRFRNDDGSETTASYALALNTDWDNFDRTDENIRVRYLITWTGMAASTLSGRHEYRLNGGAWTDANAASSVIRASLSANFADDDTTTEQLGGGGTFSAGRMDEDDGAVPDVTLGPGFESEFEFCFQVRDADVTAGDVIELRMSNGGADLDTYTEIPSITIAEAAPSGGAALLMSLGC